MEKITLITFLISTLGTLSGFTFWLVKKIVLITENVINSVNELRNSVEKNNILLEHFLQRRNDYKEN